MMLYVFHVDVGRMMSFDMTVALSSVENLKATIERLHGIPASNIVLLVSGGDMLTQSTQVSYYSAGTDTNPIYMFLTGDDKVPPSLASTESDVELREQVERCLELPAVYDTVVTRAQLALKMFDMAREEERTCERLVHEQHLQQQGWSAVVANIEDLTDEFRLRFFNFCAAFDQHLDRRSTYLELLRNFGDDLTKLARIPILPGLMPLAEEDFHGFDEFLDTDEVFSRSTAQQESVLMVGAGAAPPTDADGHEAAEGEEGATTTMTTVDSSDGDKSSTSPHKKLKMGNEQLTGSGGGAGDEPVVSSQTTLASNSTSSSRRRSLNLLQWITSKENHNTLKLMSDECIQGLGTFNAEVYEKLKTEVQSIIKLAEQSDVKEIKGLGERLCKLEEFKYKIKNMVQDQKELSTAFHQNQHRANNLRDDSILPDLCASHQSQMVVMLGNHQKIRDHRRCIAKAKDELGNNLYARLKTIVWIQNAMNEFDNRLLFYHRCLRRAERHINIIKQIHQAPCIYIAAVTEVVRRKIFSGEFRVWASKLAEDFDSIHSEEIRRRQLFNASFEGHFLNILFPGMSDMPPAFANEHPLVFDARLPNITRSDIDMLSSQLPDLATDFELPDMTPVINFFVSRSGARQRERMEELLKQQVAEALAGEKAAPLQHQRLGELQKASSGTATTTATTTTTTGGGCDGDSETDTETEFEQVQAASAQTVATSTSENQEEPPTVPQIVDTMARSTATDRMLMLSAETLTEENAASTRAEVERLRALLAAMSQLSLDCIRLARAKLDSFRADATMFREDLQAELQMLAEKWNLMCMQSEVREQHLEHLGSESLAEVQRLRDELQRRNAVLEAQRQQHADSLAALQSQCGELQAELDAVRQQLKAAHYERDCAVARAREELIHEHKTEIESLRCRFKLMTSMEHSPSDSSLEKLERPSSSACGGACADRNFIDLTQHEAVIAQLRTALESERVQAIAGAIEAERCIWRSRIFLPMNSDSVITNVGMLSEMVEEKERQLNLFRERELILTKENYQLKTRIDALTNEEGNSWLKEKIEYLNRDKSRLQEELTTEKSRRQEMESSFAALKNSTYVEGGVLPRSKSSGSSHRYVVIESCSKGDIVFVVWDVRHCQFMIVQDSPSLYFVHGDCLASLDLHLPPPAQPVQSETVGEVLQRIPMPYYAVGRVVDKEYCQARKDDNRYRVPRSSKFYRIKLEPLTSRQLSRRERIESFSTSTISRSISQCESQSETGAMTGSAVSTTTLRPTTHSGGGGGVTSRSAVVADVVDSGAVTVAVTMAVPPSAPTATGLGNKERTISITSVAEEDDEPVALLSDRCRYISVSEEDELKAATADDARSEQIQQQEQTQPQSVITEQPTATSSKLKMDLLLASADIVTTTTAAAAASQPLSIGADGVAQTVAAASVTACSPMHGHARPHHNAPTAAIDIMTAGAAVGGTATTTCTTFSPPMTAASFGTTSEDSDEYRSLEGRDDVEEDFAISE